MSNSDVSSGDSLKWAVNERLFLNERIARSAITEPAG